MVIQENNFLFFIFILSRPLVIWWMYTYQSLSMFFFPGVSDHPLSTFGQRPRRRDPQRRPVCLQLSDRLAQLTQERGNAPSMQLTAPVVYTPMFWRITLGTSCCRLTHRKANTRALEVHFLYKKCTPTHATAWTHTLPEVSVGGDEIGASLVSPWFTHIKASCFRLRCFNLVPFFQLFF